MLFRSPATAGPPKKKTRRGSRGGRGRKKPGGVGTATSEPTPEPTEAPGAAEELEPEKPAVDGTAPPRKKTRRGSRGGRGRKRPAAAGAATNGDAVIVATPPVPTIHLPDAGLGASDNGAASNGDEPAARKKTRRGSRGGRRRRKPAGTGAVAETSTEPASDES